MTDVSADEKTQHPQLPIVSVMLFWNRVEPSAGVFDWGNLDASLADARDRGYRLIVRLMCGADAPSWMASDPDHPVAFLDLLSTDSSYVRHPGEIFVPVQWDTDLAWQYAKPILARHSKYLEAGGNFLLFQPHVRVVNRSNYEP